MINTSHLDALQDRLASERSRLWAATTPSETALRTVWVTQLEKEVDREYQFLGLTRDTVELSDDALLAELGAL